MSLAGTVNGSMTPTPQSPSVQQQQQQTSLQHQQTLPVGQQVALINSQQQQQQQQLRPQLTTNAQTIPLSAINKQQTQQSSIMTVGQKTNLPPQQQQQQTQPQQGPQATQAYLMQKDGQQIVVNMTPAQHQHAMRLNQVQITGPVTSQSLQNSIVLGPRPSQQGQQGGNIHYQLVQNNSGGQNSSRPTLTTLQQQQIGKMQQSNQLAPRIIQLPSNARLSSQILRPNQQQVSL